ncbi:RrF2 family transcriptional regulator [Paludisphaera mucosa]|uniref:Rrf2 family transcriptional regulator n=1 Tax=Paludisphaera mucosa TaxID=3030827 RepID=A0ABT6F9I5_9BACT|nr:Rrf2 family transcriptional regulator [Paludisphaera mucosa]MDG3004252.1 Rrf2 family transcriptional regulator [Paludisphaera mucosa]
MLPKTAEYALRAAVCLAGLPPGPASADVLAKRTKTPRSYLNRVLQDLAAAGLVQSRPGPGGGYELAKPAAAVTILDVVNAVAPIERIRHCPLGLPSHTSLCPLHRELDQAYATFEDAFRNVTLQDLLDSTNPVVPLCDVGLPS